MLYPPFKKLCSSVRLYVRPSMHSFHSLLEAFLNQFSSNLLWELILGKSVLELWMGKFWQIITELRPLIDDRNWFSLSIFGIPLLIFFKLVWEFILGRSVLGLQIGKFWQINTELRPLIDVRNRFSLCIFGIPLPIFFKLGMRVDIVKECAGIADG